MHSDDPLALFSHWFSAAVASGLKNANAMNLATTDEQGRPHSRIVLLKFYDENAFVFFTNYQSNKGRNLDHRPFAALCFFWHPWEKQVRIEGPVTRLSHEQSDLYFQQRPRESQLGAWASEQSRPLESRENLERKFADFKAKFADQPVPRPPHWGGFAVNPESIEFWQGRENRLHDRLLYQKDGRGGWTMSRLNP